MSSGWLLGIRGTERVSLRGDQNDPIEGQRHGKEVES